MQGFKMTRRYELAEDVLPDVCVKKLRKQLGHKKTVITFRVNRDAPLTPSEQTVNDHALVLEVRELLNVYGTKSKCIYFKGTSKKGKKPHPDKEYAKQLLELGHTQQIVGDVMGVSRVTVCRWFKSSLSRGRPEGIDVDQIDLNCANYMCGVEWLCENAEPFLDIDILDVNDARIALEKLAVQTNSTLDRVIKRAYFIGRALTDLKALKC